MRLTDHERAKFRTIAEIQRTLGDQKLELGDKALSGSFPLSETGLRSLDEERVARLDQFIYRFTKLQDSMARRHNLAHDYPENTARTVATLNELYRAWRDLAEMYRAARAAYERATHEQQQEADT
ncbi:MAG: hypothetical protein ACLFRR_03220 [Spirochaetaceae bacterium]